MAHHPDAHLCLIQPAGDVAALGLLGAAQALQGQLQALGVPVSLAKNRLRRDAVNLVFGAARGFDAEAARGHSCVLVDTAPASDAAGLPPLALRLFRSHPLWLTDPAAAALYRPHGPTTAPVWSWWPHVQPSSPVLPTLPIAQRPIDLLLAAPPNERQRALLGGFERIGLRVARLDAALHGPELDALVRQARAVLILLAADGASADTAAMALALGAGTAVLVEQAPGADQAVWPPAAARIGFQPDVQALLDAVRGDPHGADFAAAAEAAVQAFSAARSDAQARLQTTWTEVQAWWSAQQAERDRWQAPDRLQADLAGQGYRPGWCNVDADGRHRPDERLDLDAPLPPEWQARSGSFELIQLGVDRLTGAGRRLDHAAALLAPGGRVVLSWPVPADGAGVTPEARLRNALQPWTDAFWRRAAFEHRLELAHAGWLDGAGLPCAAARALQARVVLVKRETSLRERGQARTMREDLALG